MGGMVHNYITLHHYCETVHENLPFFGRITTFALGRLAYFFLLPTQMESFFYFFNLLLTSGLLGFATTTKQNEFEERLVTIGRHYSPGRILTGAVFNHLPTGHARLRACVIPRAVGCQGRASVNVGWIGGGTFRPLVGSRRYKMAVKTGGVWRAGKVEPASDWRPPSTDVTHHSPDGQVPFRVPPVHHTVPRRRPVNFGLGPIMRVPPFRTRSIRSSIMELVYSNLHPTGPSTNTFK